MPSTFDGPKRPSPLITLACLAVLNASAWAAGPTTAPAASFTSDAFGHNFAAESGQVTLQLPESLRATGGSVRVTDERGRPIADIPVAAGSKSVIVPLKGKGFYALTATINTDGAQPLTVKTTASVVGPMLDDAVRMKSPFGFFSVMGNSPLPAIASVKWDRLFVPIHGIKQDESGNPMWWTPKAPEPKYPHVVNDRAVERKWVGVFMFPPPWTVAAEKRAKQSNFAVHPPEDWAAFSKVVTFATKHYAQFTDYFEPINEPDANWRGTDEELIKYHAVVAKAVREGNADAKVVGPCLSSIDIPRLRTLAGLGLFDHLDGVGIHAYSNDAPPEGKWLSSIYELKALMKSIGKEHLPILVSEYGWQTVNGDWARPVDQLSQARYAARSLTLLVAEQVKAINYFCLRYEDQRIPHVQGWSIVEQDNTPRPSFAAISNVSRWLADVDGPGTILHPAPDSYLVLFKRGKGSVAVVWTTRGEATFQLPGKWNRINDMTGRTVTPDVNGVISVTESPTFIELEDAALPAIQLKSPVSLIRGQSIKLDGDWTGAKVAAPLALKGNQLNTSDKAAAGEYLVMARNSDGTWAGAPVTVLPRFAVESAKPFWPTGAAAPVARLSVRSYGAAVDVLPKVSFDGAAPRFGERVKIPANQSKTIDVSLDNLPLDRRWTGQAAVEASVDGQVESANAPIDVAVVPGGRLTQGSSVIDWSAVPKIDSRGWPVFGFNSDIKSIAPEDCSATLQWAWGTDGLHVRVDVRDTVHQQDREPGQMWQQDSLQFAFDVDADKPWQANLNNDVVGLNGHRVFEYGVALKDGKPVTNRWREEIVKLAPDAPPVSANIVRQDDRTIYEITFPWPALGLKAAPAVGTSIGFDLAVNDADNIKGKRQGLEIFSGIHSSKDPERLGKLILR